MLHNKVYCEAKANARGRGGCRGSWELGGEGVGGMVPSAETSPVPGFFLFSEFFYTALFFSSRFGLLRRVLSLFPFFDGAFVESSFRRCSETFVVIDLVRDRSGRGVCERDILKFLIASVNRTP